MAVTQLSISRELLHAAGVLAGKCSSSAVRERVLVSQAVSLAFRSYLNERFDGQEITSDGRSGQLKYVELLDICDFRVRGWQVEVRVITTAEREALYIPTVPLMVGVLSDFYVSAQVDSTITAADIMGYATRSDLAEAELSPNGLFAVIPNEFLRPLDSLMGIIREERTVDSDQRRYFERWQASADRMIEGAYGLLSTAEDLTKEEVERLAHGLRDNMLSV